jgi:hypothetical protein
METLREYVLNTLLKKEISANVLPGFMTVPIINVYRGVWETSEITILNGTLGSWNNVVRRGTVDETLIRAELTTTVKENL